MSGLVHWTVDRSRAGIWVVAFDNPPINMLTPSAIADLHALLGAADQDLSVKVLVFESADPDFFIAHFDTSKAAERQDQAAAGGHAWTDVVLQLCRSPVISVAKIRGRTRGVGNEFVLACDLRFASRQRALLGNPEVGVGLPLGGGALEWLPRLVGRSRSLEIVLSGDDFDADVAERYGWINRTIDDDTLDAFVDGLARRLATFDRDTLAALKAQINRVGVPTGADFEASNTIFWEALSSSASRARRSKLDRLGYGTQSSFELDFGRRLVDLRPDAPTFDVRSGAQAE
ncbi:enoyl-CoA hydratase/isomerase family protein [Frateuria edaphi]|uniref:enoyl-CoA hydratase/isomerase family protein n=1 Tax=Frateuria edaphi TaxID=2898793 RepID=UPI001E601ABF|nr:enoyl-CoA hydratase/isomerase family protein [Frateuria edaphi]UGB45440.1 enoyl-CoA hydratase/isomerase family protein [Frateuria edaphi]